MDRIEPTPPGADVPDGFEAFFERTEPSLRRALVASFGPERGVEAAAEAMTYAWQHWDRVRHVRHPVAYLFTVGRSRTRRSGGRFANGVRGFEHDAVRGDGDERLGAIYDRAGDPDLAAALAALSPRQARCVVLVVACGWTYREAAEALGITRSSVQRHVERGMASLRRALGETGVDADRDADGIAAADERGGAS